MAPKAAGNGLQQRFAALQERLATGEFIHSGLRPRWRFLGWEADPMQLRMAANLCECLDILRARFEIAIGQLHQSLTPGSAAWTYARSAIGPGDEGLGGGLMKTLAIAGGEFLQPTIDPVERLSQSGDAFDLDGRASVRGALGNFGDQDPPMIRVRQRGNGDAPVGGRDATIQRSSHVMGAGVWRRERGRNH
jgi:hypothetical protein